MEQTEGIMERMKYLASIDVVLGFQHGAGDVLHQLCGPLHPY
jgi:hypothetical protein